MDQESIECLWKAWRTKYVEWGPNTSPPHVSPQGHHVTFHPRKKRDKIQHVLESLIQTAEQYQLAAPAMTSYELGLGHICSCWKYYHVYFTMDLVSHTYLFGVGRNRHFSGETFPAHGCVT
jgi:hypothetical protein